MSTLTLLHEAFAYSSDDEFADRLAPFVAEGLDEGVPVVAITTPTNAELLRDAVGADCDRVTFVDRDEFYTAPQHALAGWDATARRLVQEGARTIRAIGELPFGDSPREWARWATYEAMVNRALAHHPVWVICPYDGRVLPASVMEQAWQTHPSMVNGGSHERLRNHDPEEFVRAAAVDPEPLPSLDLLPLDADARELRRRLWDAMEGAGISASDAGDMLLAASEVLANANTHAGGVCTVRFGQADGRFVCEIADNGPGMDDPFAGWLPPSACGCSGLWVARQLTSTLEINSSPDGLTVRLWT